MQILQVDAEYLLHLRLFLMNPAGDTTIEYENIKIAIDRFSKRYLEEETQIDYNDEQGFLVGESFASSACAIPII